MAEKKSKEPEIHLPLSEFCQFIAKIQSSGYNHLMVTNNNFEYHLTLNNLKNIIAFVNPKSGGQKGQEIFDRLRKYLPKENVFDLSKGGPKSG